MSHSTRVCASITLSLAEKSLRPLVGPNSDRDEETAPDIQHAGERRPLLAVEQPPHRRPVVGELPIESPLAQLVHFIPLVASTWATYLAQVCLLATDSNRTARQRRL